MSVQRLPKRRTEKASATEDNLAKWGVAKLRRVGNLDADYRKRMRTGVRERQPLRRLDFPDFASGFSEAHDGARRADLSASEGFPEIQ